MNRLDCQATDARCRTHLRLVEISDAEFILKLRLDPTLSKFISPVGASVDAQVNWIKSYKEREHRLEEIYFIIVHEGKTSGTVRLYNFRGKMGESDSAFEWGSWIIEPPRPSGIAIYSALCVYEVGFDKLRFSKSTFEVRKENSGVVNFHLRSGAKATGEDETNFYFDYLPAAYETFAAQQHEHVRVHRMHYKE
jgi:hypothetical protein